MQGELTARYRRSRERRLRALGDAGIDFVLWVMQGASTPRYRRAEHQLRAIRDAGSIDSTSPPPPEVLLATVYCITINKRL
jgi:hypothetical protein